MKNTDNQYLFDKLNDKFDRDLDTLKERYDREAQMLMYGDASGLNMTKRRNRLWMWFDRKTQFNIFAKIIVMAFVVSVILFIIGLAINVIGTKYGGAVMLLLFAIMAGTGIGILGMIFNRNCQNQRDYYYDNPTITSPFFSDLEGNIWHQRKED